MQVTMLDKRSGEVVTLKAEGVLEREGRDGRGVRWAGSACVRRLRHSSLCVHCASCVNDDETPESGITRV